MVTIDHQPKAALHIQGNATEELLRQLTTLIIEIVLSPSPKWAEKSYMGTFLFWPFCPFQFIVFLSFPIGL